MRRVRFAGLTAALFLGTLLSCVDGGSPVGPDAGIFTASLAVIPVFPMEAQGMESAPVNLIRLTARRLPEEVIVAQVVEAVDPNASQWELGIDVPLDGSTGTQYVLEIELVNQTGGVETVQWSGRTAPLALTSGTSFEAREVAVSRGPLDNLAVTALVVDGPTVVPEQEPFTLTAQVQTSQAGSQPAVFWTALDPAIASIASDGEGMALRAGTARIQAQAGPVTVTHEIVVTPIPTSVVVTPTDIELTEAGQETTVTAAVLDRSGTAIPGSEVAWSVGDDRIVESLGQGRFRARGAGATTVRATSLADPTLSAAAGIVVLLTPVEVVVTPTQATLTQAGGTATLVAQVFAAGRVPVFGVSITWNSSSPSVATVGSDGVVTAVSAGTTVVTATTAPVGSPAAPLQATSTVDVVLPVVTVGVTPGSTTLASVGQQVGLQAVPRDAVGNPVPDAVVSWASSNPAVATVTPGGLVTAVSDGTATITASSGLGSGSATITVNVTVASVTVTPALVSLSTAGQQQALSASVQDASGLSLPWISPTWSTSNPAVATVSQAGLVTAVSDGSAVVTATAKGTSGTSTVTVNVAVAGVTVTPSTLTLTGVGQTQQLAATAVDASGNTITGSAAWSTSNPAVATVSAEGLVTARADGTATITATVKGASGTAAVAVNLAIAAILIEPAAATIGLGDEQAFAAAALAAEGTSLPATFTWLSSNPLVASVTPEGVATGHQPGTALISATTKGVSATATLTVEGGLPVASFYETVGNTQLVTGSYTRPFSAHVYDPDNALAGTVGVVVTSTALPTTAGGHADIEPDGDFSYTPPVGFEGTDQFTYAVSGGATATVEIEVIGMVWYVGYGGDGSGLSNNWLPSGSGAIGAPGDRIFVYDGHGASVEGGFLLQDSQKLIGEGVALSIAPFGELMPAGTAPEITTSSAGVVLANDVLVTGLNFVATDDGIDGNGVSSVTVEEVWITNSDNNGVTLTDATGSITFNNLWIDGAAQYGFLVSGGDADIEVNLGGDTGIMNAVRHVVRIQNTTGGAVTFNGGDIASLDARGFKVLNAAGDVYVDSYVQILNPANDGLSVQNSSGNVHLANFNAVVTNRSGIHLENNTGTVEIGTGTVQTTDAPGLDIVNALVDLNLTSVTVTSLDAGDGLHLQNVTGTTSIGLLTIVHEDTGHPLWAENAGSLVVTDPSSTILANSDDGLWIYDTDVSMVFASVTVDGTFSPGLDVSGVNGSISIAGGSIADASADAVRLQSSSVDFHYGGAIVNPGGKAVVLNGLSGGFIDFSGSIQSTSGGISLTSNTGATIELSGLNLQTGANPAFVATGGGTLEVTGTGNVISTTTGQAVNINGVDIGSGHVVFESVSANGGGVAINLNNTGAAGSFKVVGTGSPGSGGTIQSTTNNGMLVFNTMGLELRDMVLSNTGTHSIGGGGLADFTFDGLQILNSGFRGIALNTTTGTGSIANTTVSGSANGSMISTEAGVLNLDISNSAFTGSGGSSADGGLALNFSGTGSMNAVLDGVSITGNSGRGLLFGGYNSANATLEVRSGTFQGNVSDHVLVNGQNASVIEATIKGSTFDDGTGAGVEVTSEGTAQIRAEVSDNDFTSMGGHAMFFGSYGGSSVDARVFENVVSGSTSSAGVITRAEESSTMNAWVGWNDISGTSSDGIIMESGTFAGSTASASFHVHENHVDDRDIIVKQAEATTACVSVTGNSAGTEYGVYVGQDGSASNNMRVERLNGGSGTVTDPAVFENFIEDTNPYNDWYDTDITTGINGVGHGTCPRPVAPVGAANASPVAHPQRVTTDGSTPVVVTLTGADPDGAGLTFSIVSSPSTGSLGTITPLGANSAQVTYTPAGFGTDPFVFRVDDGTSVAEAAVVMNNAATLTDIGYFTAGNSELAAGGYPAPSTPAAEDLANVFDPTPGLTADNAGTFPSTYGGDVVLMADGSFSYIPAAGFTGDDNFVVMSGGESATVTISVVDMVWYVDNTSAGGDGRSDAPFDNLAAAEAAASDGEAIFVYAGDLTTTGYDQGITLKPDQRLLGEAAGLTIPGVGPLVTSGGSRPRMNRAGIGPTVSLGGAGPANNFVAGLEIYGGGGSAILGVELGATTVDNVVVPDALTGLELAGASGSILLTNTDITASDAPGVLVNGGNPDVAFVGTITADIGAVLEVYNTVGGIMTFTGQFDVNGDGVVISNAMGTINMADLSLLAGSYQGIVISNSNGTYTFTNFDADGVTGRPVSVNGGAPTVSIDVALAGITNTNDNVLYVANTTGGSVSLTGNPISDIGSGVLIDTNAGAVSVGNPLSVTSSSGGIHLSNVTGPVTFADVDIVSTDTESILHSSGTGLLTILGGSVDNTDASAIDADSPMDLTLTSLTGYSVAPDYKLIDIVGSPTSSVVIGTLTLDSPGGATPLALNDAGYFEVTGGSISSGNYPALDINDTQLGVDLTTLNTSPTTGTAVSIHGSSGWFNAAGGLIDNTNLGAVSLVANSDLDFTFGGIVTNTAGPALFASGNTAEASTVTFSGPIDDTGQGIQLTSNDPGMHFDFTGDLNITGYDWPAILATGSNVLTVGGADNFLSSVNASAIILSDVRNAVFDNVTSSSGSNPALAIAQAVGNGTVLVSYSVFTGNTSNPTVLANSGGSADLDLTITGSSMTGAPNNPALSGSAQATSTLKLLVDGSSQFDGNRTGVSLVSADDAIIEFDIDGVDILNSVERGVVIESASLGGTAEGFVRNSTITEYGNDGVLVRTLVGGVATVKVDNNTVNTSALGSTQAIAARSGTGISDAGDLHMTILNNAVGVGEDGFGLDIQSHGSALLCLNAQTNAISDLSLNGDFGFGAWQAESSTFQLERFTGTPTVPGDVITHVAAENPAIDPFSLGSGPVQIFIDSGGFLPVADAFCRVPTP